MQPMSPRVHVQLHRLDLLHDSWPRPLSTVPMTIYGTDAKRGRPQMRVNLKLVKPSPAPVNGTVPPKEVERLIKASRARGRYGARDALAILMAYRHGLRASELAGLRWDQVDFDHGL